MWARSRPQMPASSSPPSSPFQLPPAPRCRSVFSLLPGPAGSGILAPAESEWDKDGVVLSSLSLAKATCPQGTCRISHRGTEF